MLGSKQIASDAYTDGGLTTGGLIIDSDGQFALNGYSATVITSGRRCNITSTTPAEL